MGAWIEIAKVGSALNLIVVAPFMGAWIEILYTLLSCVSLWVAPFMGAWIEIKKSTWPDTNLKCRSLHGSVD